MKTSKSLARQTAAFAAAMMIVLSGAGTMAGTGFVSGQTVMTASAAESYTVNQQSFGMKTAANSVKVYHGSVLVKEYTWDELVAGFTVSGTNNTVVLEYDDGSLTFDAASSVLLDNTRESGISREEFYITGDSLMDYPNGGANDTATIIVYSTARNAKTGKTLTELTEGSYNIKKGETLTFDYQMGTDIYVQALNRSGKSNFFKYDLEKKEVTGTVLNSANNSPNYEMIFNSKAFNVPDGYESVSVFSESSAVIINDSETYGYSENAKSVLYTPNEWRTNQCRIKFSCANFAANINVYDFVQVTFSYENGSSVNYSVICDTAYLNGWNYVPPVLLDADNAPVMTTEGTTALDGKDENSGNPVVTDEALGISPQEGDYAVTVYKGAEPIETMTGKQFENGKYEIENYSPDDNYYVKVEYDDGSGDYRMFRYNDDIGGTWEQRVDTKETPEITLPVDLSTFPEEYAGGYATENGNTVADWSAEEFASGAKEVTVPTKDSDDYDFTFTYPQGSDEYVLVGIDPELKNTKGTKDYTPVPVDTNAEAGDKIHVTGETEDGKPVDFEYVVENGKEDEPLLLPDGTYTVTDETKGIKDEVTADSDNSEGKAGSVGADGNYNSNGEDGEKKGEKAELNLITPEEENHYKMTAPDGTVLDEGSVKDGNFDNIADVNIGKDLITGQPYVEYDVIIGQTNSTDPAKVTEEKGYIYDVDVDGDFVKADTSKLKVGDVNLDGKVSLKDVILLQKYLHNKENFKFENFFNADMNGDGKANIFDLALLKKELLKK